jgi:hypothetical protein
MALSAKEMVLHLAWWWGGFCKKWFGRCGVQVKSECDTPIIPQILCAFLFHTWMMEQVIARTRAQEKQSISRELLNKSGDMRNMYEGQMFA